MRFIDSLLENTEILSKTAHSNNSYNNEPVKKVLMINNDPVSLLRDIGKILDYMETFN